MSMNLKDREQNGEYICTSYWPNECNNTLGDYLCYRMVLIAVMGTGSQSVERTVWCKPRSRHWWHTVQNNLCGSEWWKENLRMSQSTYIFICGKLRPYIAKQVLDFSGLTFKKYFMLFCMQVTQLRLR